MKDKSVKYVSKNMEDFILKRMSNEKADGYLKKGVFTNEIVWGNYSYIIPCMNKKKQNSFKKGMFLFGMVRKDAANYVKTNPIKLPKQYLQIEYNEKVTEDDILGGITGTDLNHAYWRIAYNIGIISEKTYIKGLNDDFKSVRLAALSTMGAEKKYRKIVNGEITNDFFSTKGDETLQMAYKLIRYNCYKYMSQVKRLLKKDFICYKTDAIYYVDTEQNRQLVKDFFEKKDLLMKQLV